MMVGAKYHLTALVVNLLVVLTLASTVVKQSQFFDTGLHDLLFVNDVLFNSHARSTLHCGRLCSDACRCLTFTHVGGRSAASSCQGYSVVPRSAAENAMTVAGAKTYTMLDTGETAGESRGQ